MIITITGHQWAGKTTIGKLLAQKLGYNRYSTGDFMRQMAIDRNVSLLDLNQMGETDRGAIDHIIDQRQRELGQTQDNFVIDGRLAFHFIPHSFKIFLQVDEDIAAQRIFDDSQENDLRKATDYHACAQTAKEKTHQRRVSEQKRYLEYYGVDIEDMSQYDLVIDTSQSDPETISKQILAQISAQSAA